MLLATTDTVAGREATVCLGMVLASVPFFGSKYAEGISDLNGKTTADISAALEARRTEVLERLALTADHMGATAVVGVRMSTREITTTWKELCAYGTAVIV